MSTAFSTRSVDTSRPGKSGNASRSGFDREMYGNTVRGFYDYQIQAARTDYTSTGSGDNVQWHETVTGPTAGISDLGRSADERRIFLIGKGVSNVPSYREWRDSADGQAEGKYKSWGVPGNGGEAIVYNNDVYAYHTWLDNKFGTDKFSQSRPDVSVLDTSSKTATGTSTPASTAATPAAAPAPAVTTEAKVTSVADASKQNTSQEAGLSVDTRRRSRRSPTLASLQSSVDRPSILGA